MRFLLDAHLPPALARWLIGQGHDAEHVFDCGLASADDGAIWDFALARQAVILTKDEDFAMRRILDDGPPPVVWLRLGNTSRTELLRRMEILLPGVLAALEEGHLLVEVS